jgi:hypothetical protein
MDADDRAEIFAAMNKAIEAFGKELEDWNVRPAIKIEVREVRFGDMSLGESLVIDEITEHKESVKNDKEKD